MKNALKLLMGATLLSVAASPVLAQEVTNRQRNAIIEAYAAYAEVYAAWLRDDDDTALQTQRVRTKIEAERLCEQAGYPTWEDCILELVPYEDRARPEQLLGRNGENLYSRQAEQSNNDNAGNGSQSNSNNQSNNNAGGGNANNARAIQNAANSYSEAVELVNRAIANGNSNPNNRIAAADEARSALRDACGAAGYRNISQCLRDLNISVPEMAQVTVRETEDENAAALLDSQKDADNSGRQTSAPIGLNLDITLPTNDAEAQARLNVGPIQSVQEEQGTRIDQQPIEERPSGRVVQDFGDRQVVELDNQLFIQSNEDARLTQGATQTYYENLSRNRVRETIVRSNGTQLITIRNANGEILQRTRINADGSETLLVYVSPEQEQQLANFRDPGQDLPPLQLGISADEYILDADEASLDEVIDFLDSPPVESITRYYSIDEVKRSARIRDMVRRLEIGNLTFEFGSPNLAPDQVNGLYELASAIQALLQQNPGEIFLIEGHTDAVGSEYSNLLLSDRRAESVATILTQVFNIPPENLATQGYGERYLKINTPYEERLNRRVTIKRITPLVAPVNVAAG